MKSKMDMVEKLTENMATLKNHTVKLMLFLIVDNHGKPQRYTIRQFMDATKLPSESVQKAIRELEARNLIRKKYVGQGSRKKFAPEFILFP